MRVNAGRRACCLTASTRFSMLDGTPIHPLHGHVQPLPIYTVVPEIALAKIRDDAPFDKVCYIGCGVTTGIGAVINTAKVEIGLEQLWCSVSGGIGLNVIQGLRLAGADHDRRRRSESTA